MVQSQTGYDLFKKYHASNTHTIGEEALYNVTHYYNFLDHEYETNQGGSTIKFSSILSLENGTRLYYNFTKGTLIEDTVVKENKSISFGNNIEYVQENVSIPGQGNYTGRLGISDYYNVKFKNANDAKSYWDVQYSSIYTNTTSTITTFNIQGDISYLNITNFNNESKTTTMGYQSSNWKTGWVNDIHYISKNSSNIIYNYELKLIRFHSPSSNNISGLIVLLVPLSIIVMMILVVRIKKRKETSNQEIDEIKEEW